jgi:hypothetical protein
MKRRAVALLALAVASCAARDTTRGATTDELPAGVAARVADETISVRAVREVARVQGISAAAARDRLIADALLATEARALPWATRSAERAVLAREMLEELAAQARAGQAPTDADVKRVTAERWWELDRPASARTAHVAVLVKTPADEERARAVADAIERAVSGASEPRDFFARAAAVPRGGLELRAERLPPVAADGRVVPASEPRPGDPTHFELAFGEAANAIAAEGTTSPVVQTSYGFHVILLEEKLPERKPPLAERRVLVATHLARERARDLTEKEVARLRAATRVQVSRAADALTAEVRIAPARGALRP